MKAKTHLGKKMKLTKKKKNPKNEHPGKEHLKDILMWAINISPGTQHGNFLLY